MCSLLLLFVICCVALAVVVVVRCSLSLFVEHRLSRAVCCWLLVGCCLLFGVSLLGFVAASCLLLFGVCCCLFVADVCCLMIVGCRCGGLLFGVVRCALFGVRCVPLAVCCTLLFVVVWC